MIEDALQLKWTSATFIKLATKNLGDMNLALAERLDAISARESERQKETQ
jgi:hypothetical protein